VEATSLTSLTVGGGCAAKYSAARLEELLKGFVPAEAEDLLVGLDPADDAAVYRLDDERALVFTLDFFPPLVDDPALFGRIAATNALNDVFATPKFCSSRTCGPVVDVAQAVQRRFAGSGVRFIHVEVYKDNNPAQGFNRWFREWRLPSEPWVFVVGRDGRIKARFEGSVSEAELSAAVRRLLRD